MNKNEILIPIFIVLLSVVFAMVSLVVILTSGKSKFWVSKKMKIGAVLLTLSAVVSCNNAGNGTVTCYDMPEPNNMWIENADYQTNTINLNLDTSNELSGSIFSRVADKYSFVIKDTIDNRLQIDNISALDGNFDGESEQFKINIDKKIPSGIYVLELYSFDKSEQDSNSYYQNQFNLNIINE